MKKIYPHSILLIIIEIFSSAICITCFGCIIFGYISGYLIFDLYSCLIVLAAIIVFIGAFLIFISFIKKKNNN